MSQDVIKARVWGLTGGIACGKSSVASMFQALGAGVVDADLVSRELSRTGEPGYQAIVAQFGTDYLLASGELDRAKLGALIFSDANARATLNAILHPLIETRSQEHMQGLLGTHAYVIYEATLLVEVGRHRDFRGLIVVTATPQIQVARLVSRNGLSESEARARLGAQAPLAEKIAVADYVIDNSGELEATRARVLEVHQAILSELDRA